MTVRKGTVMRNDHLRKQERLGYRLGLVVILTRGAKGRAPIDLIGQGCLLTGVISDSKCKRLKIVTLQLGSRMIDPSPFTNKWKLHDLRYYYHCKKFQPN